MRTFRYLGDEHRMPGRGSQVTPDPLHWAGFCEPARAANIEQLVNRLADLPRGEPGVSPEAASRRSLEPLEKAFCAYWIRTRVSCPADSSGSPGPMSREAGSSRATASGSNPATPRRR